VRKKFHQKIALELTQKNHGGVFQEYNTKAIQYGYIAMFSSAFPLAAICAATGNFIELRIDAYKTLATRRPRYQGAEDIGTWQSVLSVLSWFAIPINVFILVFTSWDFRNLIVIKLLSDDSGTPDFGLCELTNTTAHISHHYLNENPGATSGPSFYSKCQQNVLDCYANIGGESWLPAIDYLYREAPTTTKFTDDGLCNPDSPLYYPDYCNVCKNWQGEISATMIWSVVVIEHLLILFKMLLAYIIPDRPRWVVDANARKEFFNEIREVKRRRASSLTGPGAVGPEHERLINAIEVNASDDTVDAEPDESTTGGSQSPSRGASQKYTENV